MKNCEVGYYNPDPKQSECTACGSDGSASYCDDIGMTAQNDCDANRICGDLTITPMWCPIGFYAESNECLQCPKDTWCWPDADGVDESGAATLGTGNG